MNAIAPSPVFAGVETPPDPVDGSLCDAMHVVWRTAGWNVDDIAAEAAQLRAELRRMDIELVPVVRLEASRRRSDLVALAAYTQVLAARNWALKELSLYHTRKADHADPIGHVEDQLARARRLALGMQDDIARIAAAHAAALGARDAEILRLKVEIDTGIATAGDLRAEIDALKRQREDTEDG